tara:strand:+ start:207 stop:569 length:363 start_codon:yes stop_codon:yes gene_type:complete
MKERIGMVICDVCRIDVNSANLGINKIVYGLMPVEVSGHGYVNAEWMEGASMSKFIHDGCLDSLLSASMYVVAGGKEESESRCPDCERLIPELQEKCHDCEAEPDYYVPEPDDPAITGGE